MAKSKRTASATSQNYSLNPAEKEPVHSLDEILRENRVLREKIDTLEHTIQSLQTQYRHSLDQCRELEQTYIKNREIYLLAIEATNLGIYDTYVKDEDLDLKENWLARLGYNPKLAGDTQPTWESLIHPDDYDRVISLFKKEEAGILKTLNMEYRLRAANGEWRWIIESSKVIEDSKSPEGKRIVGTHFDITKRKLAEEDEKKQRAFAEALVASTAIFNSTLDLNELLNLILINVGKVIPHDDADIWLVDKDKKAVHPFYRKGNEDHVSSIVYINYPIDEIEVFKEISTSRKPIYLPLIELDKAPVPTRNPIYQSCICAPIFFSSYLLGFLVIYSKHPEFYTPIQIEHLMAFTNQAATAIRNAQLYAQSQEAAALEERQRLAREMHDVISQTLFSAAIKAEALPLLLDIETPEVMKQHLIELHKLTRGALAEMRTMLMELRPNAIINTDLSNLLQQLVEGLAGRTTTEISLISEGFGLLPPEVQTVFFRITQEAVNNIIKHARARHMNIEFSNSKDMVTLQIKDDGCGFTVHKINSEQMGIKIMRERAESINAKLTIDSQPRKGTVIFLQWYNAQAK